MCKFYYPKFDDDKDPEEIKNPEDFIKYYSAAYYSDCGYKCGYKVKGTKRNVGQNSRYVEKIIDELLNNTKPHDERDWVRILSWKIGKIKQRDSENAFMENKGTEKLNSALKDVSDNAKSYPCRLVKEYEEAYENYVSKYDEIFKKIDGKQDNYIVYANKWLPPEWKGEEKGDFSEISSFPFVGAFGRKLGINDLIKILIENEDLTTKARGGNPQEALNKLMSLAKINYGKEAINGIGTVYLLTVLYFLSNGEWPIYDRFADKALKAILGDKKPGDGIKPDTLPGKNGYVNGDKEDTFDRVIQKHIDCYKKRIEKAFGGYDNYKNDRNIDRALWVYGHLFL